MRLYDIPITAADGSATTLTPYRDKLLLVVNTASRCGLTDQYAQLTELQDRYGDRGLAVVAFPCNQFNGQEPGSDEEIQEFCSTTYGIDFPVFAKIEVNGPLRHALYKELTVAADADGNAGDVEWNFEKYLVAPGGESVLRIRPRTTPLDPSVLAAIEALLPAAEAAAR